MMVQRNTHQRVGRVYRVVTRSTGVTTQAPPATLTANNDPTTTSGHEGDIETNRRSPSAGSINPDSRNSKSRERRRKRRLASRSNSTHSDAENVTPLESRTPEINQTGTCEPEVSCISAAGHDATSYNEAPQHHVGMVGERAEYRPKKIPFWIAIMGQIPWVSKQCLGYTTKEVAETAARRHCLATELMEYSTALDVKELGNLLRSRDGVDLTGSAVGRATFRPKFAAHMAMVLRTKTPVRTDNAANREVVRRHYLNIVKSSNIRLTDAVLHEPAVLSTFFDETLHDQWVTEYRVPSWVRRFLTDERVTLA